MKLRDTIHFQWYKKVITLAIIFIGLFASVYATNASFSELINNLDEMRNFLLKFVHPDFNYIPRIVEPMIKTIQMSIFGTFIGVSLAIPISFLAASIVTQNKIVTLIFRFILGVIRTIPNLLLASLLVAIFGIGEFTGVLTISIFTLGMVSQLIFETIEIVDFGPIEAVKSIGANKIQTAVWAIWPQIISQVAGYTLYSLEVNIRASIVLGYVGAGGIGLILNSSLALLRYDRLSVIIISILLVVAMVDFISGKLRKELS